MIGGPSQRGFVLLSVLAGVLFLSVLGALMAASTLRASQAADEEIQRFAAQQALATAILLTADSLGRRTPNMPGLSMPRTLAIGEFKVRVDWAPSMRQIDVNLAPEPQIADQLVAIGMSLEIADTVAAQIGDWRDPDNDVRANGAEALEYGHLVEKLGNRPFYDVFELGQVLDFPGSYLDCAATVFTVEGAWPPVSASGEHNLVVGQRFGLLAEVVYPYRSEVVTMRSDALFRFVVRDDARFEVLRHPSITFGPQRSCDLPA